MTNRPQRASSSDMPALNTGNENYNITITFPNYRWGCSPTSYTYMLRHRYTDFADVDRIFLDMLIEGLVHIAYSNRRGETIYIATLAAQPEDPLTMIDWVFTSLHRPGTHHPNFSMLVAQRPTAYQIMEITSSAPSYIRFAISPRLRNV